MSKQLILTVVLATAALAGILYATQGASTTSFLRTADQYKYQNEFMRYKVHYAKTYGTDEGFFRYKQYETNMDIIAAHNAKFDAGNSTFFLGENAITDLNLAEYSAQLLGFNQSTNTTTKNYNAKRNVTAAPSTIDWTTKGAVNPVKDQGQCGSCWAFSAVSALESLNFIKNGKLVVLSEQSLMDCSRSYGNMACHGGLMDNAFKYTQEKGLPTDASYPYTAKGSFKCNSFTSVFKNTGFTDVTPNSDSALQAAIAQGPVSVAIEADTSVFQLYAGGIFNDAACGTTLDHGVVAVGYGTDFWKVRNSWGNTWGEQGYIRLARTGNDAGMCGIQQGASYPTA